MHRVVILAFEGFQTLDATGPFEVFSIADRLTGDAYTVEVVAPRAGPVRSGSGLGIVADRAMGSVRGPIGTLLVVGGEGVRRAAEDERVVSWVRSAAARSERVASVCTGAFLLADDRDDATRLPPPARRGPGRVPRQVPDERRHRCGSRS